MVAKRGALHSCGDVPSVSQASQGGTHGTARRDPTADHQLLSTFTPSLATAGSKHTVAKPLSEGEAGSFHY
jgi:hypothetical protein